MRRDFLTVIAITVVVLVCVFIAWPRLGVLFQDDAPTPLPPRERVAVAEEEPSAEQEPALRFRVFDALTSEAIDFNTLVRLETVGGRFVDEQRGWRGRGVMFDEVSGGIELIARVELSSHLSRVVGPFTCKPGEPREVRVELAPLFEVSIAPNMPGPVEHQVMRVFSAAPPELPHGVPLMHWRHVDEDRAYRLPPGRYWLHVPRKGPTANPLTPYGDAYSSHELEQYPGIPTWGFGFLMPFEVTDADLRLEPEVVWPKGTAEVQGRLSNSADEIRSDARVLAMRLGPGTVREIAGVVRTDADGEFRFGDLVPGHYGIQVHPGDSPTQVKAFAFVDLAESGARQDVELVHDGPVHYSHTAPDGSARIQVLMRGKPVAGARLLNRGKGFDDRGRRTWLGWEAGEDGWVTLNSRPPQQYLVSCRPWTMQSRRLEILPGKTSTYKFEIWPEGTGSVMGSLPDDGPKIEEITFQALKNRKSWHDFISIRPEEDGTYAVYGMPRGDYRVEFHDAGGGVHARDVFIGADSTVVLDPVLTVHTIRGTTPAMDALSRDCNLYLMAEDDTEPRFSQVWPSPYSVPRPKLPAEFQIEGVPAGTYRLVAQDDQRNVQAVSRVNVMNGDATVEAWVPLRAASVEKGGRLIIGIPRDEMPEGEPAVRIYLDSPETGPLLWRKLQPRWTGSAYIVVGSFFPPGKWDVRIEVPGLQQTMFEYDVAPESLREIVLRRPRGYRRAGGVEVDDQTDAHDRPIGGVKIRLPAPVQPPPVPPVPWKKEHRPPAPPPMTRGRADKRKAPEGATEFIVVGRANENDLWNAVLHFKGERENLSVRPLDYTWRGTRPGWWYEAPHVSVCQQDGELFFWVRGVHESITGVKLQVAGCEPVTVDLMGDSERHDVELVPVE